MPQGTARFVALLVLYHCGFCLLLAALPDVLIRNGEDTFSVGLIVGAFAVGAIVTRLAAAKAMNTLPARKLFALAAILQITAGIGYFAAGEGLYLALPRFVHGSSCAFFATAIGLWISDAVPVNLRGTMRGLEGGIVGMSLVSSPAIGLLIAQRFGMTGLSAVVAALSLITIFIPLGSSAAKDVSPEAYGSASALRNVDLLTGLMLGGTLIGTLQAFMPLIAQIKNDISLPQIFIVFGASLVLGRVAGGILSDRIGRLIVMRVGAVVSAGSCVLLQFAEGNLACLAVSAAFAFGISSYMSAAFTLIIDRTAGLAGQGGALSSASLAWELGVFVGPVTIGLLGILGGESSFLVAIGGLGVLHAATVVITGRQEARIPGSAATDPGQTGQLAAGPTIESKD